MADIATHPLSPCNSDPFSPACKDAFLHRVRTCLIILLGVLAVSSLGLSPYVGISASGPGPTITVIFNLDQ